MIPTVLKESGVITFFYTGSTQTFTVPAGVYLLTIDAYGAQGGATIECSTAASLGGYIEATVAVTPGQVLTIIVGGAGCDANTAAGAGGYGGGGAGSVGYSACNIYGGAGGGGATYIQTSGGTPLVVAGGGGGYAISYCGAASCYCLSGGAGGATTGGAGTLLLPYCNGYTTAATGGGQAVGGHR